ncbi:MAG: type I 3-dehydroquinate dehydratase [Phycisphaerales bacterium]|nr:type I 3-dehydroquinate dehydratase [Phycisphaerales bacterium]
MTIVAVSIAVARSEEIESALVRAASAGERGADMVEWRVDALAEDATALEAISTLCARSPLPCIVTVRSITEGGIWEGEEVSRVSLIEAIALSEHRPAYIDFELAALRRSANIRHKVLLAVDHPGQVRTGEPRLLLSSHDFQSRPPDLLQRVLQMWNDEACAVAKIVWRARSVRDNLEAFEILANRLKPTIALCMGEFGLLSRVLARKFGAFLTFVRAESEGTAPGQPSLEELLGLYRFRSIGSQTKVFGVVGWPIGHSHSPRLHNAAFGALGFDGVLLPLAVPPEWEHFTASMGALIDARMLDFTGCAVTIPHKEHLVRFVRARGGQLDAVSEMCGAANTLVVEADGKLRAFNTDAPALVESLSSVMGPLSRRRIAVIGAGGTARAAVAGLVLAGAEVHVCNRTEARVRELMARFAQSGTLVQMHSLAALAESHFDAIVNTTPLGMTGGPDPQGMPFVPTHDMSGTTVLDAVYTPRRTPWLIACEGRGAQVISGTDLFIRQAKLQCGIWTGQDAPAGLFESLINDGEQA